MMFLHYISDEKIKTTRDEIKLLHSLTFQFHVLLNSVDSLAFQMKESNMKTSTYKVMQH